MVVGESVVVGALILVAWHELAGYAAPSPAGLLSFPPAAAAPADSGLPATRAPVIGPNPRGPASGLNLGIGFWRVRLGTINRDEAAFEAVEWRITHAVMEAARDYLETVVLPAVRRAEGGGAYTVVP